MLDFGEIFDSSMLGRVLEDLILIVRQSGYPYRQDVVRNHVKVEFRDNPRKIGCYRPQPINIRDEDM